MRASRANYIFLVRKNVDKIVHKIEKLKKEGVVVFGIANLPENCRDYAWASARTREIADQIIEFIVATLAMEAGCSEVVRKQLNTVEETAWKLYRHANRLCAPIKKEENKNEVLYFSRRMALLV